MKAYVIRHSVREQPEDFAEAEEGDPEAELTEEGEEIAKSLGQWMADNGEVPSVLYVSPTVRAHQTAEHIVNSISDAGYVPPDVKTDSGIGPFQSIKGLLDKCCEKDEKRVGIISHRGSIKNGLQAMAHDADDAQRVDSPAMGEMRVLKVKRGSGKWSEKQRVRPSDLGHSDNY